MPNGHKLPPRPLNYAQFCKFREKITEFDDLDATLSARYFSALREHFSAVELALNALFTRASKLPMRKPEPDSY